MRMWMVNPQMLCRQHLLGEHNEIHKHRHNFVKRHSVSGRVSQGHIEPASMERRHDELVLEMQRRGYNHQSPFVQPDISYLSFQEQQATVNVAQSIEELCQRCVDCKKRFVALQVGN